jgi:hypothetical protein
LSLPQRIAAYDDCFSVFEHAKTSGARVKFGDYAEAKLFTLRLHQARALQREEHKRIYPKDSPQWGYSEYDHLMVRHPQEDEEGKWWVYIELSGSNILSVETLGQQSFGVEDESRDSN